MELMIAMVAVLVFIVLPLLGMLIFDLILCAFDLGLWIFGLRSKLRLTK